MRTFNRRTIQRMVSRIMNNAECAEQQKISIITESSVLVDPDSFSMVIALPCLEGDSVGIDEVGRVFWKVAVERGWAEEKDRQKMALSVIPLEWEEGEEPSIAIYGEIVRPDTHYPDPQ